MVRLNLGSGAVAFEIEGEADRVDSLDPGELITRHWPLEVVENYRRYRERASLSGPSMPVIVTGSSSPGEGQSE
jgi:hypothetical protein